MLLRRCSPTSPTPPTSSSPPAPACRSAPSAPCNPISPGTQHRFHRKRHHRRCRLDHRRPQRGTLHPALPLLLETPAPLFDGYVTLQRALRFRRRIPQGLTPHLGSQWWCLTRPTLQAHPRPPRPPRLDRYFRRVWIPDESYFQSLVRQVSTRIESRSLTLSKFDYQGRPYTFYDDHLHLLRQTDAFLARKIWPQADLLYRTFLTPDGDRALASEPNPGKINRLFAKAVERRVKGRPGLYMQSRFPIRARGGTRGRALRRFLRLQPSCSPISSPGSPAPLTPASTAISSPSTVPNSRAASPSSRAASPTARPCATTTRKASSPT
jgi:hypothetical protein